MSSQDQNHLSYQSDGHLAMWYCRLQMVLHSFRRVNLRLVLTLATMAIGSLGLSATLFLGQGALQGLWKDLDSLMGNRVIVEKDAGPGDVLFKSRTSAVLTKGDLAYVKQQVTHAKYVVPRFFGRQETAYKDRQTITPVDGITQELTSELAFVPIEGRSFSPEAISGFAFETLVTVSLARSLSIETQITENQNPTVRIGESRFTVVGIVPDPPEADFRFRGRVVIPYRIAHGLWGNKEDIGSMLVSWPSPELMEPTVEQLRIALDTIRAKGAYSLSSSQFSIRKRRNIVSNFILFGSLQALFSILVASIGIVNVMLANVVQRSREFAIRMAMGARAEEISIIVIIESFMLGIIGAAIGILLSIILSPFLANLIAGSIPAASQLVPKISLSGVLIPLLVSGVSGLVAGIVPAIRARRTDVLAILKAE